MIARYFRGFEPRPRPAVILHTWLFWTMPQSQHKQDDLRSTAERFAKSLDADDFQAASKFLSPDCQYSVRDKTLEGPAAIIESYREASQKARRLFDGVEYGSEIVEVGPQHVVVKYWDRIEKDGHSHVYTSLQQLTFGHDGRIVRALHREIPGERESLTAFMKQRSVESDGNDKTA